MKKGRLHVALVVIAVLAFTACGQPVPPAGTPARGSPATEAVPTPSPAPFTSPTPNASPGSAVQSSSAVQGSKVATYSPERTKELVAQGFYLPGMEFGHGQEPRYGGMGTFSNRSDLAGADPMFFSGISNDNIMSSITGDGGLVRAKPSNIFEPEPYVALSWTVEDNYKSWTFKLRQDIKWHDGTALTAEDIKFWIDLAVFPPSGRSTGGTFGNFGPLKEVQVVDRFTVRLVEKDPTPHLLETLLHYSMVVTHPKHLAKPVIDGGNAKVALSDFGWAGIGPFKFDSYQKGSSFKVIRNEGYFLKDENGRALPYLDAVYYPMIPDPTVAVSALRAGRIDGTSRGTGHHMTPDMIGQVRKTLGDKAWFMRLPYTGWSGGPNALKQPFDNLKLRQALNLYTDRQDHIRLVYGGLAIESDLMVPGSYWADPTFRTWPGINQATRANDRAEAKRLVREAGLEGAPVNILCRDVYINNCEFLDLQIKGLGLNSKLEVFDQLRVTELTVSGNYQIQVATVGTELPDQAMLFFLTTNPRNINKHGDAKIDDYHKQIVAAVDPIQRRTILWEAQKYLIQEKAYVQPWPREEAVIAYRTHVKGLWVPSGQVHYNNDMGTTWLDTSAR